MNNEKYLGESSLLTQPKKQLRFLLGDKAVKTHHIDNGAVTGEKIADGAITMRKFASSVFNFDQDISATISYVEDAEAEIRSREDAREDEWNRLQTEITTFISQITEGSIIPIFGSNISVNVLDDGDIELVTVSYDTFDMEMSEDGELEAIYNGVE